MKSHIRRVHLMAGVAVSHISCVLKGFDMAPYVDYLTFSPLNPITNLTPRLNANLTIGATAHNPNYWGSHVYANYRGSCMQP
jgi:hypothetical protein